MFYSLQLFIDGNYFLQNLAVFLINVVNVVIVSPVHVFALRNSEQNWKSITSKVYSLTSPVVFLSKKLYPHYLALVGSRNRCERDFTIKLNKLRALWKIDLNVK